MSTTLPTNVPAGFKFVTIEERIALTTAAANFPLLNKIPAGAIVYAATLVLPIAVLATTAVKVGLGRVTTTADPDKYAISTNLTAQAVQNLIVPNAILAAEETIGIFACATDGAAAGTIGGAGQTALVSITYAIGQLPT